MIPPSKPQAAGVDVSGQDVGHIIAHGNGGADHDHNYTMQVMGLVRADILLLFFCSCIHLCGYLCV